MTARLLNENVSYGSWSMLFNVTASMFNVPSPKTTPLLNRGPHKSLRESGLSDPPVPDAAGNR